MFSMFHVHGWEFEVIYKGCEGGSVDPSSLTGYNDDKWLDLPTSDGDSGNVWCELANFMLHNYP